MPALPKPLPLADELRRLIGARRVRVAVFLTYQFDPSFFESEVIQTLVDCDWSRNRRVALAQAEDVLRQIDHLAVYYDARGLERTQSASLDYRRFGVIRTRGVFHAKNILLLLDEETDAFSRTSLLLITTSANLTQPGWWRNVEAVHAIEIPEGSKTLIRDDLLGETGLLTRIVQHETTGTSQIAIEEIRKFLRYKTEGALTKTLNGFRRPRLFAGQQRFGRFLSDVFDIEPGEFNLEIISPYFENTDEAPALQQLLDDLAPRQTRVFLPRSPEGTILCSAEYFATVSSLPRVVWGTLPTDITRYSTRHERSADRFVHAKVYRFFSAAREQEFIALGSVNMTEAAQSNGRTGNLESAVIFEVSNPTRDWWLRRDEHHYARELCEPVTEIDDDGLNWHMVALRFDWEAGQLAYFWKSKDERPPRAEIRHASVPAIELDPVQFDAWIELPSDIGTQFREALLTTSFVEIIPEGGAAQLILVREENMISRPSLTKDLKPEEILEFWALLSSEQRAAHIADKLDKLAGAAQTETSGNKVDPPTTTSMFDRFAGIFHAFSCLRHLVFDAVINEHAKQAKCLLFGSKHDSLRVLIDRLSQSTDFDPVNSYVVLLCSAQLLTDLNRELNDWVEQHRPAMSGLRTVLGSSLALARERLQASAGVSTEFLPWFEKMFAAEIPEVLEVHQQ